MKPVLAIDVGTSGVRAIVFRGDSPVAAAHRELATDFPQPGWAAQDPLEVWNTLVGVAAEVVSAAETDGTGASEIAAIGIANQRSSILAWDAETLEPLSPVITWHDLRGADRAAELTDLGYFVNASVAVTKAEWLVRNHKPVGEAAAAGRLKLGGPESYLVARLSGGAHVIDHANASATGFYAPFDNAWEANLLELTGIDPACMPEIIDSCGPIAETTGELLGRPVPIAGLCGDQQAALYGLSCADDGQTKCTYGTAAMVDANSGENLALRGEGAYPLVAWTGRAGTRWCVEGNVNTAGAAVQWLRDGLSVLENAAESSALAESVPSSGGVWSVPAFQGLGTPYMVSEARAAVGGLSRASTRAHVVRAMLEGVAQCVTDVAEAVWENGTRPAAIRVDGGASRNDFMMQFQADLLGMPVERSSVADGAALGAARLAAVGIGERDHADAVSTWSPDRVFEPSISGDEREALRVRWKKRVELVAADLADTADPAQPADPAD